MLMVELEQFNIGLPDTVVIGVMQENLLLVCNKLISIWKEGNIAIKA